MHREVRDEESEVGSPVVEIVDCTKYIKIS